MNDQRGTPDAVGGIASPSDAGTPPLNPRHAAECYGMAQEIDVRRAAKVDGNHEEIVDALRAVGAHVTSLAAVHGGCPDLLVSRAARWYVIEVKDCSQPPSARLLTPDQKRWHAAAQAPVHVANSVSDALAIIGCGPKAA